VRILIISNLLPPRVLGGYELACWNLAKGLRDRGHEVLVLTSPTELFATEDQSFVERTLSMLAYEVPATTEPHMKALVDHRVMVSQPDNTRLVLDALRRFRPDHVIAFNLIGIGAMAILDLLNTVGVPWTMNLGDRVPGAMTDGVAEPILKIYGFEDGAGFRQGSYAIASQGLADEIAADGVDLGSDVRVISRGVRPATIARSRDYRAGGSTRFVAAGSLGEHKGVDLMIAAAAILHDRGTEAFTVDVYGQGDHEHYAALAVDAGVRELVRFPGVIGQDELFAIEAASDAFLFPTWSREPFGSAPLEAASVGCVPILTANCGAAERLIDGVDSIMIERTAQALADAMNRVISGDVDLAELGAAGMARVAGPLSFEHSVIELENFVASFARPGWTDGTLDEPETGAAIVDKNSAALGAFFEYREGLDTAAADRASGSGTLRAAVRGIGDIAGAGGRSILRRTRGGAQAASTSADESDARFSELEFQLEAARKGNLALRHQIDWPASDRNDSDEAARRRP
jgi:glycogen(starch) synthase